MIIEIINETIDFSTQMKIIKRNEYQRRTNKEVFEKNNYKINPLLLMNFASLMKHLVYDINKFEKDISGNRCT